MFFLSFLFTTISFSDAFVVRTSFIKASMRPPSSHLESSKVSNDQSLLKVELEKPLGLILEECESGEAKGVYVLELAENGSAAVSEFGDQLVGLPLAKVMGNDVSNLDFDSIMDQLIAAPSPISLDFIASPSSPPSDKEIDGFPPGTTVKITVLSGKEDSDVTIEAKVGDNLRKSLLDNDIEVYSGLKQKLGNCGGGGTCTFCAADFVKSEGWCERSDYEDQRLANAPNARLSCLNNIQGPATIRLL